MAQGQRYVLLAVAILGMGAVRLPIERAMTAELDEAGLLPPKLEVKTGEKIGQTLSAVSLGGLRTLVATFLNLRAFTYFTEQRWGDVAEMYDMIVDLSPRTEYYWDTGSWHQAYNAASYYLYESDQPPLRRKLAWRESILKGREFLERGIRINPRNGTLRERLGFLLSDPNKIGAFGSPAEAYEGAYEAYSAAEETGNAREMSSRFALYSLARIPGREKEALELAERIAREQGVGSITLMALLYTLRYHEDPEQPVMDLVDRTFPSHEVAYRVLSDTWVRTRENYPVHGVARAIVLLETELGIPEEKSPLNTIVPPPMNPDDYFR